MCAAINQHEYMLYLSLIVDIVSLCRRRVSLFPSGLALPAQRYDGTCEHQVFVLPDALV
jgi:hypothetical protein